MGHEDPEREPLPPTTDLVLPQEVRPPAEDSRALEYDEEINKTRRWIAQAELVGAGLLVLTIPVLVYLVLTEAIKVPPFVASVFAIGGLAALLLNNGRKDTVPYQVIYKEQSAVDDGQSASIALEVIKALGSVAKFDKKP